MPLLHTGRSAASVQVRRGEAEFQPSWRAPGLALTKVRGGPRSSEAGRFWRSHAQSPSFWSALGTGQNSEAAGLTRQKVVTIGVSLSVWAPSTPKPQPSFPPSLPSPSALNLPSPPHTPPPWAHWPLQGPHCSSRLDSGQEQYLIVTCVPVAWLRAGNHRCSVHLRDGPRPVLFHFNKLFISA